jgi:hypothetical protein
MTLQEKLDELGSAGTCVKGSLWNRWIECFELLNWREFVEKYAPEELEGLTDE